MHQLVLIGPPASGKGTQSERIQKLLGFPVLGTGGLLRNAVHSNSQLGKEVEGFLQKGEYVPDVLILQLVQDWLEEHQGAGWLLDGFPRTLLQAQALDDMASGTYAPTLVIALDVPQQVLEARMENRRECLDCGRVVSVKSSHEKVCAHCGGRLLARADDTIVNFRNRYGQYKKYTEPLLDYYSMQGKLLTVDGIQDPESIFSVIQKHF